MNDDVGDRPVRRRTRLDGHDYALAGTYFVTIVTFDRRCCFGGVVGDTCQLSDLGRVIEEEWLQSAAVRDAVSLDAFVVMPNHLHGIVVLDPDGVVARQGSRQRGLQPASLGAMVGGFKAAAATRRARVEEAWTGQLWQRGYYDHIVRSETDLARVREYIADNPRRWTDDGENPEREGRARGQRRAGG